MNEQLLCTQNTQKYFKQLSVGLSTSVLVNIINQTIMKEIYNVSHGFIARRYRMSTLSQIN